LFLNVSELFGGLCIKPQYVNFDIEVIASKGKEGKAKVSIPIAGAGGSMSSETKNSSRIKFTIPMILPTHENEEMKSYRISHEESSGAKAIKRDGRI